MAKTRQHFTRPLISRSLRSFDTLAEAGRFIDRLTQSNQNDYRFNIVQQGNRWNVCSIVSGGVQS